MAYRRLLYAVLTDQDFSVSPVRPAVAIKLADIQSVKLIRNIFTFGFKVRYINQSKQIRILLLKSSKYDDWARAFRSRDVPVEPSQGWFEFDLVDFFRQ